MLTKVPAPDSAGYVINIYVNADKIILVLQAML
jgi:hypothetical protein